MTIHQLLVQLATQKTRCRHRIQAGEFEAALECLDKIQRYCAEIRSRVNLATEGLPIMASECYIHLYKDDYEIQATQARVRKNK